MHGVFQQAWSRSWVSDRNWHRDTVSSVGVIRGKSLPGTNQFDNSICYFRHALALDERRVKFLPEYICGGESYNKPDKTDSATARVKEVWFAGCHSDMFVCSFYRSPSVMSDVFRDTAVAVTWRIQS